MKTYNILSVIPGTRYLGIAIFQNTDLRDWSIKCLKGESIDEKAVIVERMILKLIPQHNINTIAIKKLHPSRSSASLEQISTLVRSIGQRFQLKLIECAVEKIKQQLLECGKGNKMKIMEEVVRSYPCLHGEYQKEKKNKNKYFMRMFEAVALGIIVAQQFNTSDYF